MISGINRSATIGSLNDTEAVSTPESVYGLLPIPPVLRNGVLVFGGLYALLMFFGAMFGSAPSDVQLLLAVSDVVVITGALLPFILREWKEGWLSPMIIYSVIVFASMIVKRSGLMLMGLSEHTVINASASHLTGLVAYDHFLDALSMVSLIIGYRVAHGVKTPRLLPSEGKNLVPLTLVVLGISAVALVIYIGFSGNLMTHIKNLTMNRNSKEFESDNVEWTGVLVSVACFAHMGLLFLMAYRPKVVYNPLFYIGVMISLVILALASGKRSVIINPVLLLLLIWAGVSGRMPYFRVFVGMVMAVFALGFLGALRTGIQRGDVQTAVSDSPNSSLGSTLEASLEEMTWRVGSYSSRLAILDAVPDDVPLQWGYTYYGALVKPIPRALMPDKPTGTDSYVARTFFGADWGIPAGGVGEAYWNFHIPGIVAVYFLFGTFKAWWRNFTFGSSRNPGLLVCYLLTMFVFSIPCDTAYTAWLFTIIPAFVCLRVVGGFRFDYRKKSAQASLAA